MAVNIGDLIAGEEEIVLQNIQIPALKGEKGDTGRGISTVIKTSTVGLVDTWTITYTDGSTSIFQVTNGADGQDGDDYIITSEDYESIADIVLDNIEIPSKTSDLTNDSGFIDKDVDNLTNYYKTSETYNKTEVDNKISSVYKYKGTVATYADLPSTSLTIGDVYNVESTGDNYAWTGTTWDKLGGEIDLSEYYTKAQVDSALENKVDKVTGKGLSTNDFTNADKTKLNSLENYDDTEVKSDIETLEESQASQDEIIAKLKADHPEIEEEGTELSLQGTGDFDLALSPKGNITQDGEPSPNNEIPVKVVDGEYEVEVENKNVFNENNVVNGYLNDDGTVTSNANFRVTDFIEIPDTITNIAIIGGAGSGEINCFYNSNKERISSMYMQTNKSKSAEIPNNAKYFRATLASSVINTFAIYFNGNITDDYVEHKSQTQTIDTSPNPLYSENDYYYKSNGEWYVHNEWGKVVLNGTENWLTTSSSPTGTKRFYYENADVYNQGVNWTNKIYTYSDKFKSLTWNDIYADDTTTLNAIANFNNSAGSTGRLTIRIEETYASTLNDFKTWLSTHNTTVIYQLATPTNTQIANTDLINSLEALSNMLAYQDQTNISQTHNSAQADMRITADTIMSMRYLQNEIEELKQAILNS